MCGIVGYIGDKQAYPVLIKGLKRLEYRGYDSAGIALLNGSLNIFKKTGKVSGLEEYVKEKDITGTIGIAHTRWATHGEPNDVNTHPHCSHSKDIATKRGNYEKVVSNIQEVKARKGKIIAIVTKGDKAVKELTDCVIEIPETEEMFVPLLATIPLQLLSYHIATMRDCNVDQPRNLTKSVTVE